jgi:hypothetical protein
LIGSLGVGRATWSIFGMPSAKRRRFFGWRCFQRRPVSGSMPGSANAGFAARREGFAKADRWRRRVGAIKKKDRVMKFHLIAASALAILAGGSFRAEACNPMASKNYGKRVAPTILPAAMLAKNAPHARTAGWCLSLKFCPFAGGGTRDHRRATAARLTHKSMGHTIMSGRWGMPGAILRRLTQSPMQLRRTR